MFREENECCLFSFFLCGGLCFRSWTEHFLLMARITKSSICASQAGKRGKLHDFQLLFWCRNICHLSHRVFQTERWLSLAVGDLLLREDDDLAQVLLQASNIAIEALFRLVLSATVDGNADRSRGFRAQSNGFQFSRSKSTSFSDLHVVTDRHARNGWAKQIDWTGANRAAFSFRRRYRFFFLAG